MRLDDGVDRIELAAALLQYDDDDMDTTELGRAMGSAVLTPFRHLLIQRQLQRDVNQHLPADDGLIQGHELDTARPTQLDYRLSVDSGRRKSEFSRGIDLDLGSTEGTINDDDNDERLVDEWGLSDHLSQLRSMDGRGSSASNVGRLVSSNLDVQLSPLLNLHLPSASSVDDPDTEAAGTVDEVPRYKILERRRPQSTDLSSAKAIDLSTSNSIPSPPILSPSNQHVPRRLQRRRSSAAALSNARSISPNAADHHLRTSSISLSAAPVSDYLPSRAQLPPSKSGNATLGFTSRFDPSVVALARQEIEADRPVFLRPQRSPVELTMPPPLSGTLPSAACYQRTRTEGPILHLLATIGDEEQEDREEQEVTRLAGTLYGRSLLDILAARKSDLKGRQRHYVGNDGRKSMMQMSTTHLVRESRSTTVFGPDLVYARDMEKLRAQEDMEADAKRREEEAALVVSERARYKQEEKKPRRKLRKAAPLTSLAVQEETEKSHLEVGLLQYAEPSPNITVDIPAFDRTTEEWFRPRSDASSISSSSDHIYRTRSTLSHLDPRHVVDKRPQFVSQSLQVRYSASIRASIVLGNDRERTSSFRSDRSSIPDHEQSPESFFDHTYDDRNIELGERVGEGDRNDDGDIDDDDEVPLGSHPLRVIDALDDDVPLALRHAFSPTPIFSQHPTDSGDDDDRPLGHAHPSAAHHQQQQQQYAFFQQQQFQQQIAHQQNMLGGMEYGQNGDAGYVESGQSGDGGGSSSVDRWRRGISTSGIPLN